MHRSRMARILIAMLLLGMTLVSSVPSPGGHRSAGCAGADADAVQRAARSAGRGLGGRLHEGRPASRSRSAPAATWSWRTRSIAGGLGLAGRRLHHRELAGDERRRSAPACSRRSTRPRGRRCRRSGRRRLAIGLGIAARTTVFVYNPSR